MEGAVACPKAASEDDGMFCILDEVQADIARDALQHFAILSGKDDKTKGRILRASKALQRLLNYDLDTPFPRDLSVFWGANTDRAAVDEITASIKSNRPYSGEVLCYKHTGQTVWCEISLQAIAINQDAPHKGSVCIACFIRDVDELHCADQRGLVGQSMYTELKEDHAEQSRIVQLALQSTLILEPAGTAFAFSDVGEGPNVPTVLGFPKSSLAGKPMHELYGAGTTTSDRRLLERAMQDHEPLSCDIMCYTTDNEPWWRHMLAIPIECGAFLTFNVPVTRAKRYIGKYLLGNDIGRGSFGTVKLAKHKVNGTIVAIKRINDVDDARTRKLVDLEIEMQGRLKHPLIAELYEVMKVDKMVFMVMEHCAGGSLFDKLVAKGGITEDRARPLFRQIVESVEACHDNGIVHRDLKPENLLLDKSLKKITLIDFGLATYFVAGQKLTEVCGSKRFQAPEVMRRATCRKAPGYEAPPVDVWSLAVILFELVHGQIRLSQSDSNSTAEFIQRFCDSSGQRGVKFSDELSSLLRSMLVVDPSKRMPIVGILAHPWLQERAPPVRGKARARDKKLDKKLTRPLGTTSRTSPDNFQAFRSGTDGDNLQGGSDWAGAAQDEGGKKKGKSRLRQKLTGGGGAARAQ